MRAQDTVPAQGLHLLKGQTRTYGEPKALYRAYSGRKDSGLRATRDKKERPLDGPSRSAHAMQQPGCCRPGRLANGAMPRLGSVRLPGERTICFRRVSGTLHMLKGMAAVETVTATSPPSRPPPSPLTLILTSGSTLSREAMAGRGSRYPYPDPSLSVPRARPPEQTTGFATAGNGDITPRRRSPPSTNGRARFGST